MHRVTVELTKISAASEKNNSLSVSTMSSSNKILEISSSSSSSSSRTTTIIITIELLNNTIKSRYHTQLLVLPSC